MDIDNLQATVTAGSCSSRVIFNVPKARSTGVELEWTSAPTDRFDFAVAANYGKSELRSTLTSTDAAGLRHRQPAPRIPQRPLGFRGVREQHLR